jgi:hypothetical protein
MDFTKLFVCDVRVLGAIERRVFDGHTRPVNSLAFAGETGRLATRGRRPHGE